MNRRKPEKVSRKNRDEKVADEKVDLKSKLREKLREKNLERTSKFIRDNMMETMEKKLNKIRSPTERKKIKKDLAILEKIQEKENNFAGEYPEYCDTATYGGGLEHPE